MMADLLFLALALPVLAVLLLGSLVELLTDWAFQMIEHRWGWRWEGLDR